MAEKRLILRRKLTPRPQPLTVGVSMGDDEWGEVVSWGELTKAIRLAMTTQYLSGPIPTGRMECRIRCVHAVCGETARVTLSIQYETPRVIHGHSVPVEEMQFVISGSVRPAELYRQARVGVAAWCMHNPSCTKIRSEGYDLISCEWV